MNKALETLKERGFFQQCTDIDGLSDLMDKESVTFYVGTDPTGPSLHIGHMVPFFALRHLREAGHCGIALIGGGTARIGDPSGKTEMRKIISYEEIDENVKRFENQLNKFIGFDGKTALLDNNKYWLADMNYIDFMRDIGSCFSVNRMLTFESYKKRMETGLSFLEFSYQLLQSYDFLKLHERHNCCLQIGGDDQWGNIVAGADLIRRKTGKQVYGLTFPLITRSDGKKMGKTEKGALFLDPTMTPVFDFFQYWRNVADADVRKFFLLFTFLPVAEIDEIMTGDINKAKERLAWEVTAVIHGKEEADKALAGAKAAFGGSGDTSSMPTKEIVSGEFQGGLGVVDLFFMSGLSATKSEARRLVQQGGAYITGNDGKERQITDIAEIVEEKDFNDKGELILRAGKKKYLRIVLQK
ncbi:MAG: tyrosine--tRNA ligase [Candidatus Treponema excrementipullorum]|nr:tyrosine--tRNA ligase [Spirochaetia bacterium]MDY2755180.1 tyrosine--tRNA ligase [Candidatus Treponema excrementipullorum]MCI6954208.1 tyrosine--tRNA ligase [Spirochaetia bacterium]MCI7588258.1 tyrosine--tRNA ligase [Spirochaetia bacterium]MDY4465050.1 tyrosine--tRNA ligase [Candidatus Treponema excrementipullorum]